MKRLVEVTHRITGEKFLCFVGKDPRIEAALKRCRAKNFDDPLCEEVIKVSNLVYQEAIDQYEASLRTTDRRA